MKTWKRIFAAVLFLGAAFFGAQVTDPYGVWGNPGLFATLLIVILSFSIMAGAVSLWRSAGNNKNTEE